MSGYPVSEPRFEPMTSKIRIRNANHSVMTVGVIWDLKPMYRGGGGALTNDKRTRGLNTHTTTISVFESIRSSGLPKDNAEAVKV